MIFNFFFSFRIVHILVQTLVSGIITDVFIINPDLLNILFDHLDLIDLKNPLSDTYIKAECVAKMINVLFDKFTTQVRDFIIFLKFFINFSFFFFIRLSIFCKIEKLLSLHYYSIFIMDH